jgi:ABC-type transport system involved in multi-copper enzyme maturation permease subunit
MFKITKLELKHILKMRSTKIIFFILIVLAIAIAFISTYAENGYNSEGQMLSGIEAVHNIQQVGSEKVLSEKYLADIFEKQKVIYKKYGDNIPNNIFEKDKYPYNNIIRLIEYVYGQKWNYDESAIYEKLSQNDILKFYDKLKSARNEYLKEQLGENTRAYKIEQERSEKIKIPFYYYPYVGWDAAIQNLGLGIAIIAFLCCTLAVQLFSGNYQNGADIIFRTTKNGRKKLPLARTIAMAIVGVVLYAIYTGVYMIICIILFGKKGLKDPVQLLSIFSCSPYTIGQVLLRVIIVGAITVISVIMITLGISAKVKSSIYALVFAIVILMLPTIISSIPSAPNFIYFIGDIFPSSGIGIYGELIRSNYYSVFRTPYIIIIASILNIFLGVFLTKYFYGKHEGGR